MKRSTCFFSPHTPGPVDHTAHTTAPSPSPPRHAGFFKKNNPADCVSPPYPPPGGAGGGDTAFSIICGRLPFRGRRPQWGVCLFHAGSRLGENGFQNNAFRRREQQWVRVCPPGRCSGGAVGFFYPLQHALFAGGGDRRGAGAHPQLVVDVHQMGFDGGFRQEQFFSDVPVR